MARIRKLVSFIIIFSVCFVCVNETLAAVSVRGYFRKDGTYVHSYTRSNPDGIITNNWSYCGNRNPITGAIGSIGCNGSVASSNGMNTTPSGGNSSTNTILASSSGVSDLTTITAPTVNDITSEDGIITGKAQSGLTITVKHYSEVLGTTTADSDGNYSIQITPQAKGTFLEVVAATASGDQHSTWITVKAPPIKEAVVDQVYNTDTYITGSTTPGVWVEVRNGEQLLGYSSADNNGHFSLYIGKQPTSSDLHVTVKDLLENKSLETTVTVMRKSEVFPKSDLILPPNASESTYLDSQSQNTQVMNPNKEITVEINEQPILSDQPPIIINGRTLLPLRSIFESLGATVDWVGTEQKILATKGENTLILQIGNQKAIRDQQEMEIDVPPVVQNNRTMIPLRVVAEAFGMEVQWEPNDRNVTIQSPDYIRLQNKKGFFDSFSQLPSKTVDSWEDGYGLDPTEKMVVLSITNPNDFEIFQGLNDDERKQLVLDYLQRNQSYRLGSYSFYVFIGYDKKIFVSSDIQNGEVTTYDFDKDGKMTE